LNNSYTIETLSNNVFYIGNYCVDAKRGKVSIAEEVHPLEPKVMTVLLYLALKANNVVEQELLFAKVWPKSIYSPGSIRRCITILRKVFQDEGKNLIATHPKRGYSLNVQIRLQQKSSNSMSGQRLYFAAFTVLILSIILCYFWFGQAITPVITDSHPVTSTKQLEDFAQISPDGRYIAFVRHPIEHHLEGHIWLKDLTNDKEYKLTKIPTYARNISWHSGSKALLYVSVKKQGLDIVRMSIDFDEMKSNLTVIANKPDLNWISSLIWGTNNTLYYIAKKDSKTNLFSFNLSTGEDNVLLTASDSFDPFELALSHDQNHLAIIGWHKTENSQIKLLSVAQLEKNTIEVVQELLLDKGAYEISWHPNDRSFLLSDGRQLYHLDLSGKMDKILYENFHYIRFAHFAPDGNSIAIISEKLDIDIWLSSLQNAQPKTLVFDSNSMDRNPKFSPEGDRFVFITASKGYPQLYTHHLSTGKNQLIYENKMEVLSMSPPTWNALGNKVAFSLGGLPIIIEMDNTDIVVTHLENTLGAPLQWYKNENSLLLEGDQQASPHFLKLDLTNNHLTTLFKKSSYKVYLDNNDEPLFISKQNINKLLAADSLKSLHNFSGQVLRTFYTTKGIYLYVKNQEKFALWLYSFSQQSTIKITEWDENQRIADIDSTGNFALTHTVRMEKDIIFLTLQ